MPPESPTPNDPGAGRRIGDGPQPPSRPLIPRWVRLLLYPVFSALLFVPALRRLKRDPHRWNLVRTAVGAVSVAAGGFGFWWGAWWLVAPACAVLASALLIRPSADPDRERDLQRRHQADYLLNGGKLAGSWPAKLDGRVEPGTALYLLLRGQEILAVAIEGSGEAGGSIDITSIEQILVAGEDYRPVYISEAKDPPVREQIVNKRARTVMALVIAGGETIAFEYEGAFSKHLAETAAHAIYSVRQSRTAHGVAGQSPEIFHIVGR